MDNKQLIEILESVKNAFSVKPEIHLRNHLGICAFLEYKFHLDSCELAEIFERFPVNGNSNFGSYLFTNKRGELENQKNLWIYDDPHKYDRAKWAESALEQLKMEMKDD